VSNAISLLIVLAITCLFSFQGCSRNVIEPQEGFFPWDTTFQFASIRFPSDSILARSVANAGNDYRLSRFFAKSLRMNQVKLGFIGGSITGGAQATDPARRFSTLLKSFLGKMFTNATFTEINAGIGATNSRFACSRVQDDLLAGDPDLIVLEFAVNDDHADPATTIRTMEGLIRQCLKNPDVPVILFQTMDSVGNHVNHIIQDSLARHYGLPVVSYHDALRPLIESKVLAWRDLSPDQVHPNDQGHLACAYLLYAFLKQRFEAANSNPNPPLPVASVLADSLYENAAIIKSGDTVIRLDSSGGWSALEAEHQRVNLVSMVQGDKLTLHSRAREVTLMYQFTKTLDAKVEIAMDGSVLDTLDNHFEADWGGGFLKPKRIYIDSGAGEHTLVLSNLTGGEFDIKYVLFAP
jgi:acyl-CoA thioesterase-1